MNWSRIGWRNQVLGTVACLLMSVKSDSLGGGWMKGVCGGATIGECCFCGRFGGFGL